MTYLANGLGVVLGGALAYAAYYLLGSRLHEFILRALGDLSPLR